MDFSIPEDLAFTEILPRMPVKSLMRFKCVSKSWFAYITNDPYFIATHLVRQNSKATKPSLIIARDCLFGKIHRAILLLDESKFSHVDTSNLCIPFSTIVKIVGSCNGLLCIEVALDLMLWNPATREFRYLPTIDFDSNDEVRVISLGFGFDDLNNDYKVIRMMESQLETEEGTVEKSLSVQVFSKASNSWRQLLKDGSSSLLLGYGIWRRENLVAVNGAFHSLAFKENPFRYFVLSFRLREKILQVTELPRLDHRCPDYKLIKWKESLGVLVYAYGLDECHLFSMKTDMDNNNEYYFSWIKTFKVSTQLRCEYFCGVWRDQFLLYEGSKLSLYDPNVGYGEGSDDQIKSGNSSKKILKKRSPKPRSLLWFLSEAHGYVKSLVSGISLHKERSDDQNSGNSRKKILIKSSSRPSWLYREAHEYVESLVSVF